MTCASCGSPMAADQRYCLTCGSRGSEARLPFLDALRGPESQVVPHGTVLPYGVGLPAMTYAAALPPSGGGGVADRLRANAGLLAGVGVLLLALLVGVAIGAGFHDSAPQVAAAPATQVIRLEGGAAAAPAATVAAAGAPTGTTAPTAPKRTSSASTKRSSKAPVRSTNSAVKKLDGLTGAAAVKAADKLGKTVAVGGKAPKKDKKPAAAGGSFQDIG